MAGLCCGIKIGDNEPTSPVEPATRSVCRRKLELRQLTFIADVTEPLVKRHKIEQQVPLCSKPPSDVVVRDFRNKTEVRSPTAYVPMPQAVVVDEPPKYGLTSVCGKRRDMEDAVSICPSFCRNHLDNKSSARFHFFGVFDGHGCSHVAMKCKEKMHAIVKEEIERRNSDEWIDSMSRSFIRMDKEVDEKLRSATGSSNSCRCELQSPQCDAVGSTAVVAVVTPEKIIVSNTGDSRAVLCRNGVAIPLSSDHKPDRPDELIRIEEAGGRVIYWDGPRVLGMLAMSRAIGDNYLKPYVIPDPEVMVTDRSSDDECWILASDGLWDVISNETAISVARMCLKAERPPCHDNLNLKGKGGSDKACTDASLLLTKLALARRSTDNVTVVVIDLRRNGL